MERERMTSIKSASTGTAPVQGGGTSYEERMNNSICLIDLLSDNLRIAELEVRLTRKALAMLSDEEQRIPGGGRERIEGDGLRVLEVLYIDKQKNGVQRLCDELCCDDSTVWRKATRALSGYCTARHGTR